MINNSNDGDSFNPSKTFGGERARMMFMKGDMDDYGDQKQGGFGTGRNNEDKRNLSVTSPHAILPGYKGYAKHFYRIKEELKIF
jgi:hypothetical protein